MLYESGGNYKSSKIMTRMPSDHEYVIKRFENVNDSYFAEGSDFYIDKEGKMFIYLLTWRERKIIKYDKDFNIVNEINLDSKVNEGWGLTHNPADNTVYYMSDGSNNIYECDPTQNFKVIATHPVNLIRLNTMVGL